MVDLVSLLKRPTFLLKLVELVLASLCTALVATDFVAFTVPKMAVVHVTIMGFLMVNSIVILSFVMDTPLHRFILLLVTASGAVMFITAGSLMCETYSKQEHATERLLGSGILAMINCCVYIVDMLFTFKEIQD